MGANGPRIAKIILKENNVGGITVLQVKIYSNSNSNTMVLAKGQTHNSAEPNREWGVATYEYDQLTSQRSRRTSDEGMIGF